MRKIEWKLTDDKKSVVMMSDGQEISKFDAAGVDEMLRGVGMLRGLMWPSIEPEYQMDQFTEAIPDPRWVSESERLRGDSLLHIRDPRFGWLHYMIPALEAKRLGGYLSEQAEEALRSKPGDQSLN